MAVHGNIRFCWAGENGGLEMKKLLKFVLGVGAVAGTVAGVFYFLDKKKKDEFEDFDDDDFEDVFQDDDEEDRDYVTLDFEGEETEDVAAEKKEETEQKTEEEKVED
jgi:hypothetical protein